MKIENHDKLFEKVCWHLIIWSVPNPNPLDEELFLSKKPKKIGRVLRKSSLKKNVVVE